MKEFARKAAYFFGICGWVLGTIGGFGYAAYNRAWLIAVCVLYLGILSFGKVREFAEKLLV